MTVEHQKIEDFFNTSTFQLKKAQRINALTFELDCSQNHFKQLLNILSKDEIERANRYHLQSSRRDFIIGRGLLRQVLSHCLAKPASEIKFEYSANGKPSLKTELPSALNLNFNVSHSHRQLIIAISYESEIGVDIEWINNSMHVESVSELVLSEAEKQYLVGLDGVERQRQFFQIWTLKEAYLKAQGCGLTVPLPAINTRASNYGADSSWKLQPLDIDGEYMAALCTRNSSAEP